MIPAQVNDAPPLVYTGSIDVLVLPRDGPDNRPFTQWRTAAATP